GSGDDAARTAAAVLRAHLDPASVHGLRRRCAGLRVRLVHPLAAQPVLPHPCRRRRGGIPLRGAPTRAPGRCLADRAYHRLVPRVGDRRRHHEFGIGKYSAPDFATHMIVHMTLNMLVPVFLVLGGPITLALRAARPKREELAGLHTWITWLLNWRVLRWVYNPLFVFAFFIISY